MTNQLTKQSQALIAINAADQREGLQRAQLPDRTSAFSQTNTRQQAALGQWFSDQSLGRKCFIGWLTAGTLSIAGIIGIGTWSHRAIDQAQLVNQAKAESTTIKQHLTETLLPIVWQQNLLALALVLTTNAGLAILLYRALVRPVKQLQQDMQMFSLGDQQVRADANAADEVGKLAAVFNQMADSAVSVKTTLSEQAQQRQIEIKQARLINEIAGTRVRTDEDLNAVLEQAVQGARSILNVDRVVIYRFYHDWSGYIATESVGPGLPIALADKIEDPCISPQLLESYRQGRVVATNDVFNAGFHPDHVKLMTRLQIKANLVTPILKDDQLYGLLIAHHCQTSYHWQPAEVEFLKQLAIQIGLSLDRVTFLLQKNVEMTQVQQLYQISSQIRNSFDPSEIYMRTVRGVRETLQTDRAIVYLFDADWKGTVVAESVEPDYPSALGAMIADPCFAEKYVEKYRQGRVQALEDIHNAGLTDCHLAQLEPFKVRANLVAPIIAANSLHGLLIVHQCSRTRLWEKTEISFFKEVAAQIGLALDRAAVLNQLDQARQTAEHLAQDQRQQKDALQQQLVLLLEQVEGAALGDLTVRADVTAEEMGTVADFFNAIIESLRQIVVRVKQSATQVNTALGENEATIQQLATEALKQSEDITQTLSSIDQMNHAIQAVAENAHQATIVTNTASAKAEASQVAIDFTVRSIFELRETMSETAHKMKRLGESSQAISKVISLINQIALKTNMLALNAGIEAARAGENGLGFAVVAEEVGELAAQSSSATQEIEQLVDDIQRETRQVLEAMEQSTVQMVEGTRLVEDAKQNLGQLRQLSQQTDELVRSISSATISQTQISQSVASLMQELAQMSQRTASLSQQVTSSLQQTVGIAQDLQVSVSTFSVEAES